MEKKLHLMGKIEKAKKLIAQCIAEYKNIGVACSFGKDSMVLLDLCLKVKPDIPVFSLLADSEFEETLLFVKKIVKKYHLKNYREFIFHQKHLLDKELCCNSAKVKAMKQAMKGLDGWISGVRKSEGHTRHHFKDIEITNGLAKFNPILDFTEIDVWRYLALFNVPVNPLYQQGYRSLGCRYCSTPEISEEENERAGRWRGSHKAGGECGIHTEDLRSIELS